MIREKKIAGLFLDPDTFGSLPTKVQRAALLRGSTQNKEFNKGTNPAQSSQMYSLDLPWSF